MEERQIFDQKCGADYKIAGVEEMVRNYETIESINEVKIYMQEGSFSLCQFRGITKQLSCWMNVPW